MRSLQSFRAPAKQQSVAPPSRACVTPDDDKSFEVIPLERLHPAVPLLSRGRAIRVQQPNMPKSMPGNGSKKSRGRKQGRNAKGWLSGTTLQDVADFTGAVWKYGRAALTLLGNTEEKYFDVTAASASMVPAASATVVNLSNIVQGTDYNQRLGNSIRALTLRLDMSLFPGTSTTYAFGRVVVFRDLMQSGTDPTVAQLLEITAGAAAVNSAFLHYTADRFEILCDEAFPFAAAAGPAVFHKKFAFRIADHILYSATAGADASNWQGALYLLFFADQGTAANQPLIHYYSRLSYTDD